MCFLFRSVFPLHEGDRESSFSSQDVGEGEHGACSFVTCFRVATDVWTFNRSEKHVVSESDVFWRVIRKCVWLLWSFLTTWSTVKKKTFAWTVSWKDFNFNFNLCVCVCRWSSVRTTRKLWNRSTRIWSTGLDSSDTNANNVSPKSLSTWSACANWSSRDSKSLQNQRRFYIRLIIYQGCSSWSIWTQILQLSSWWRTCFAAKFEDLSKKNEQTLVVAA